VQIGLVLNNSKRAYWKSCICKPGLLDGFVLDDANRFHAWPQRGNTRNFFESVQADLFNFKRDDIRSVSQSSRSVCVAPLSGDALIDDKGGRAIGLRVHYADVITHGSGCHRGHASELAAAQDCQESAWHDDFWFSVLR
jgi:hypothetical protein